MRFDGNTNTSGYDGRPRFVLLHGGRSCIGPTFYFHNIFWQIDTTHFEMCISQHTIICMQVVYYYMVEETNNDELHTTYVVSLVIVMHLAFIIMKGTFDQAFKHLTWSEKK